MNSKCLCSHVRDWHYQLNPACAVTACGCTAFRPPEKPDLDRARALAAVEVERIRAEYVGCTETADVATGFGVLRCDLLRHPHPGLNHHDPQHKLWWAVDEIEAAS